MTVGQLLCKLGPFCAYIYYIYIYIVCDQRCEYFQREHCAQRGTAASTELDTYLDPIHFCISFCYFQQVTTPSNFYFVQLFRSFENAVLTPNVITLRLSAYFVKTIPTGITMTKAATDSQGVNIVAYDWKNVCFPGINDLLTAVCFV